MNPSKKYMPNNRNITDEDDIKLVPFNTSRPTPPNNQSPFSMSTTGWIPVYFFNNPAFNNMGPGIGDNMANPLPINGFANFPNLPNMNMNKPDNTDTTNSTSTSEKFYPYSPLINPDNRELPNIIQLLSDFDLDLDEDVDLVRNCSDKSIDKIYEKIEKNHPEIFALVKAYNIPCPIFKLLIRRVIKISMNYCKREGE